MPQLRVGTWVLCTRLLEGKALTQTGGGIGAWLRVLCADRRGSTSLDFAWSSVIEYGTRSMVRQKAPQAPPPPPARDWETLLYMNSVAWKSSAWFNKNTIVPWAAGPLVGRNTRYPSPFRNQTQSTSSNDTRFVHVTQTWKFLSSVPVFCVFMRSVSGFKVSCYNWMNTFWLWIRDVLNI